MNRFCLLVLALLVGAPLWSVAATPPFVPLGMPHQGRLLDEGNEPVEGVRAFTFRLYREPVGGEPAWQETLEVTVLDGYYSALLGDPSAATPTLMTSELFAGPLFLGVSIDEESELQPRLRVATVPFAQRAELANTMLGGSIVGATITDSEIDATQLSVGGGLVIDPDGRLVGLADQLQAERLRTWDSDRLGDRPASDYVTVDALESEYPTREQMAAHDDRNWVANGSFELGDVGAAVPFWEALAGASATVHANGQVGTRSLRVNDNDNAALVGVRQIVVPAQRVGDVRGMTFTLAAYAKKLAGAAGSVGRMCVEESDVTDAEVRHCVTFPDSAAFERLTLTHTVSATADHFAVVLYAGQVPGDANDYLFDAVILTPGTFAPEWKPHFTEQIYEGGIPSSKLVQGAGSGLDADLFDGRDSSDYFSPGTINDPANPVDWTRLKGVPEGLAGAQIDAQLLNGMTAAQFATVDSLSSPGTVNAESNPVDWGRLKGVPAGLAGAEINADLLDGKGAAYFASAAALAAPGTLNDAGNPVDWTKLKGVPTSLAPPVGSVTAWLKSQPGTPALPDGWVECNGQVLQDTASPYHGQTLPNLNGGQRFLRGGTASGATGGSVSHAHSVTQVAQDLAPDASSNSTGTRINAANHLPPFFDVVWILKVR